LSKQLSPKINCFLADCAGMSSKQLSPFMVIKKHECALIHHSLTTLALERLYGDQQTLVRADPSQPHDAGAPRQSSHVLFLQVANGILRC
jgi:hypothetical protein